MGTLLKHFAIRLDGEAEIYKVSYRCANDGQTWPCKIIRFRRAFDACWCD